MGEQAARSAIHSVSWLPSSASGSDFHRSKVAAVAEKIKQWVNRAMMEGNNHSLNLDKKSVSMKSRDRKKVATTFHGAGIVVPYNKQTEVCIQYILIQVYEF